MPKLKLLTIDQLKMSEIRDFEQVSGYTMTDVMDLPGGVPMSVLMALAYVTEKRSKPSVHRDHYLKLSPEQFMQRLTDRFDFDQSDDDYGSWTVAELKAELVRRGFDKAGKKPELVERLRDDDGDRDEGDDGQDPTEAA